jgi:hypothetical protein
MKEEFVLLQEGKGDHNDRLPFVRLHYRGNHKITVCLISPQISRFALHCEVFTFSRDFL